MPGSTVVINGGWREYYVGDSKMEEVLKVLDELGELTGGIDGEGNVVPVVGDPEVTTELRDAVVKEVKGQVAKEDLFKWLEEEWFKGILPPAEKFVDYVQTMHGVTGEGVEVERTYHFFTDAHRYHVVAKVEAGGHTYLGCQASQRKPYAGEGHTRGSDLPDGPFTKETWDEITRAIVGRELVQLWFFSKKLHHPAPELVEDLPSAVAEPIVIEGREDPPEEMCKK